jgi:hypothetical protein
VGLDGGGLGGGDDGEVNIRREVRCGCVVPVDPQGSVWALPYMKWYTTRARSGAVKSSDNRTGSPFDTSNNS